MNDFIIEIVEDVEMRNVHPSHHTERLRQRIVYPGVTMRRAQFSPESTEFSQDT